MYSCNQQRREQLKNRDFDDDKTKTFHLLRTICWTKAQPHHFTCFTCEYSLQSCPLLHDMEQNAIQ